MTDISDNVQRVFNLVVHLLGKTFSRQQLILFTASCRGKKLLLEQQKIPIAISGYCLALKDVDLIVTRQGMDEILTDATILHEIAHLLLRHIPAHSNGPTTPTYATFRAHEQNQPIMYRNNRYDDPQEQDAEMLATLLLDCITHTGSSLSEVARDIHGW
ncbi:MAG: hypothetical protein JO031_07230 [Ktedonobacteraceae bacterium]|nr:hypothetical protein [Ktedonobacteraceae bacterium]